MNKNGKILASIFKLKGLKCYCGNDLKVSWAKPLGEKYILLKATEFGKKQRDFHYLYDIGKEQIIFPGSFTAESEDENDENIKRIISNWESGKW